MLTTNEFLDKFDKELLTFEECKKISEFLHFQNTENSTIFQKKIKTPPVPASSVLVPIYSIFQAIYCYIFNLLYHFIFKNSMI